jgi:nucleotide-binding universal stress UspA family protein
MKPIAKILVTIDLDLVAAPILDLARQMALAFGAKVDLVQVFETEGYHGPAILDLDTTPPAEVEHWRRVLVGVVEEEVASLAMAEDFDLIIIGSHGREGLDRLLNASISEALIRMSPCPVLVLPHVQDVTPD